MTDDEAATAALDRHFADFGGQSGDEQRACCGVVYFGGQWHGVRGARYTYEQVLVFPGIERASSV